MESAKCDFPCDGQGKVVKLSQDEMDMLEFRVDFSVQKLCQDHYKDQFSRYPGWQNKCSDPYKKHGRPAKIRLNEISLEFAKKVRSVTEHRVIPGQKLCRPCLYELTELINTSEPDDSEESEEHVHGDKNEDPPITEEFDSPQFDSPM